jgi:hypothetical protein
MGKRTRRPAKTPLKPRDDESHVRRTGEFDAAALRALATRIADQLKEIEALADAIDRFGLDEVTIDGRDKPRRAWILLSEFIANAGSAIKKNHAHKHAADADAP